MMERKTRMGRPREIKGGGVAMTLYLNQSRVDDFRKLCNEVGISVSEGLRQLMEQELEKKEQGLSNPINISYNAYNLYNFKSIKPTITIPLDDFIDMDKARTMTESIVIENRQRAFVNSKKIFQQLQRLTTGKMTIL